MDKWQIKIIKSKRNNWEDVDHNGNLTRKNMNL